MILTVDIGNTCMFIGGFEGDRLVFKASLESGRSKTEHEYAYAIQSIISLHGLEKISVKGSIISSVVPKLTSTVKKALKISFGIDALVVGPGVKTGLKIKCDDPSSVGADLIGVSVAVQNLHSLPCLVVDMGTATKMIYIDDEGAFSGVIIAPGVNISLDALVENTSQLPEVSLDTVPRSVIGKNTADSIRSGIIFGNAAMVDGMVEKIMAETQSPLTLISTGELSSIILPHSKYKFLPHDDLLLKGLNIIYKKHTEASKTKANASKKIHG